MNALLIAKEALLNACKPIEADAMIIVPTPFTYPDGDPVRLFVTPRTEGVVVLNDGGATVRNYILAGGDAELIKRAFKKRATNYGFHADDNLTLLTPPIPATAAPVWAGFLAQCVIDMSEWLATKHAKETVISIRKLLDTALENRFGTALEREAKLQGASGKIHKFHWVIHGPKEIAVDAVSPEGAAVYAAFSKHMDLAMEKKQRVISRIAYDPEEHWRPGDLNFLQEATQLINYRTAVDELAALAA